MTTASSGSGAFSAGDAAPGRLFGDAYGRRRDGMAQVDGIAPYQSAAATMAASANSLLSFAADTDLQADVLGPLQDVAALNLSALSSPSDASEFGSASLPGLQQASAGELGTESAAALP